MAMSIADVAIVLIFALMIVPAVGFGILRSRWDRQGGRPMMARARILMLSSLYGGAAVMLLGEAKGVSEIRDFGIFVLVAGVATSMVQSARAGGRR